MDIEFSKDELGIINNALNEVLNGPDAIEDWEFGTRMGADREEALTLLKKVKKVSEALK